MVNPDVDEHYGESELRACYRAWFSKDVAIKLRNIYMERHAGGFHVITPPKDKGLRVGTPEYAALVSLLSNINTKTGIILPSSEYKIEGHYPSGSGADIFEKTIDQCDTQISRGLLVPNLLGITPAGQTGSYSQSQTQLDAFFWTLGNDADRLAECINEQIFKPLGEVNFADEHYPRFAWNPLSKTKAVEIIKLFMELVNSKVLENTPEDEDFIREALDLPAVQAYASEQGDEDDATADDDEADDDEVVEESGDQDEDLPDETIMGQSLVKISHAAFKSALSRVSFAAIGVGSEGVVEDNVHAVAAVTDDIAAAVIEQAKAGGDLNENIIANLKSIRIDSKMKGKLNKAVAQVLRQGERIGRQEAAKEIDKAMKTAFSFKADYSRMDMIAEDYFKAASFRITGNVTDEVKKTVEAEILNGARYDKTWTEVETAIYARLASKGLLSVEEAKRRLGDSLNTSNPDARIRTIVRTSTFEAINTARDSYFTDPQLGGFVRAYEYSAILDSRTTDVCRHLDEDGAGDHSVEWYKENAGFKPPNHFNCRSLLVAVTANDLPAFTEGPQPNITPQEGFA